MVWERSLLTRWRTLRPGDKDPNCQQRRFSSLSNGSSGFHSPRARAGGTFCQRSATQSWSRPSRSPCIALAPDAQVSRRCAAGEMRPGSAPQLGGAGEVHDDPTHQNVRNNQSYTRLNNPAMVVVEGRAPRCRLETGRDVEMTRTSVKSACQKWKVAQVFAVRGFRRIAGLFSPARLMGDDGRAVTRSQPGSSLNILRSDTPGRRKN